MTLNGSYTPKKVQRKQVRRSKFEIWAELLEACARTPRTQSWLLRRVGLKTQAIKEALDFLVTSELIENRPSADSDLGAFQTTKKGEEALQQYYDLVTKYFISTE